MLRLYRWLLSPAITMIFGAACRFEPQRIQVGKSGMALHGNAAHP